MRRFRLGDRGMGLVETLTAIGISSVVAMALAALVENMSRNSQAFKFNADSLTVHEELRSVLGKPGACLNSFGGIVLNGALNSNRTQIRDFNNAVAYDLVQTFGDRSVRIESMRLTNYADTINPEGQMQLIMTYRPVSEVTGNQSVVRSIAIQTTKSAANNLTGCIALARMTDGLWRRNGATNDIFYMPGNVGINTATPSTALEVRSEVRATNAANGAGANYASLVSSAAGGGYVQLRRDAGNQWFLQASPAANFAYMRPGNLAANPTMAWSMNGNVGIGTPTPLNPMHIHATASAGLATAHVRLSNTTNGNIGYLASDTNGFARLGGTAGVGLGWDNGGTFQEVMRAGANGFVGMGTTGPAWNLHINSPTNTTVAATSTGGANWSAFATITPAVSTVLFSTNVEGGAGTNSNHPFITRTGMVERSRMTLGGQFLVGKTAASSAGTSVEVNGAIRARQGAPNAGDFSTVGFSFDADGDTGMFSTSGGPAAGTVAIYTNSQQTALFRPGQVDLLPGLPNQVSFAASTYYALSVYGRARNANGVWDVVSDRRLKRDIKNLEGALEAVLSLQAVRFRWNDKEKDERFGPQIGYIAQDVENVFPEWVHTDEKGFKSLSKIGVESVLSEAIKEFYHAWRADSEVLHAEIDQLKEKTQEIDVLKRENEELKKRLEELERGFRELNRMPAKKD